MDITYASELVDVLKACAHVPTIPCVACDGV